MPELEPDADLYEAMLILTIRQSDEMGRHAPAEDPLERMRLRVRSASNRLTGAFMSSSGGPVNAQETRTVAEAVVTLAAAVTRGLNDSLNAGALSGYVAVTEDRVAQAVEMQAGSPSADPDEISDIDAVIDGWLTETNAHVAPLLLLGTHPDIIVREAFATIGAAAALAAELMRRDSQPQG